MMRFNWMYKVFRGDVSPRARLALVAGTAVLAVATAFFSASYPLLRLSAVAIVYVVVIEALAGLRWGIFGAVSLALLFSAAEWFANSMGQRTFAFPNFFSRLVVFLVTVLLVEVIVRQARALTESERERDKLELAQLKGQLAESDARFLAVSESIPFGLWHCNAEGRVIHMSRSFLELTGMTLADVRNGGWFERVVPEDAERIRTAWRNRDTWSELWEDEYRIRGVDDRLHTILCRGREVKDERGERIGWTGVNFDLTERAKARDQLRFLADAGRLLSLSLDPASILERVANLVVPRYADWCSIDIVGEQESDLQTAVVRHRDPEKLEVLRQLRGYPRDVDESRGTLKVLRTGKSELYEVISDELLRQSARDTRFLDLLQGIQLRSVMIVPLRARDSILGVMTLAQAESGRNFSEDDVRFGEILAARAALAYDNARSYAKEQRVADTFQRASLPRSLPRVPGVRLRATYVPGATESEIGGDWYDAFSLPDGKLAISIGDVAGKGLRAAVSMASARQALRSAAFESSAPGQVLSRVNRLLTYEGGGMVTALFGVLDPLTMNFSFASAGHPPPLLARSDGKVETLLCKGLPLGLFSDHAYDEVAVKLDNGSLLVLYTDGLIEFNRDLGEGERILREAVAGELAVQSPDPSATITRRVILGAPQDDVAVLTVSVSATPLETLDLVVASQPANARVIRQSLRRFAAGVGLDELRTTSFLVACGEAISNVIEHAYGIAEGPLLLRAFREEEDIIVNVKDRGRWRAPRPEGRGRGLPLMNALMDKVEVERDQTGTTVSLRMSLAEGAHDRTSQLSARGR